MSKANTSPLDSLRNDIEKLVAAIWEQNPAASVTRDVITYAGVRGIPTSERSVQRALERWGLVKPNGEVPSTEIEGDRGTVVSKPEKVSQGIGDVGKLLEERGLSSEEWDVETIKVNEWDSPTGDTLRQLTANLRRKKSIEFPQPAQLVTEPRGAHTSTKPNRNGKLVTFVGDQQAPYHDEVLHERFCEWLEENQPDEGVLIGDTIDLPDISRHRNNPENTATVQECIDTGSQILFDYVEASPNTKWRKLPGNHDERLRNTLIDWAVELYGLRRADPFDGPPESPVVSPQHLLRLDELGIEYIDPQGQYDQAQVNVSKYLAARHGWIAVKGAGVSALKTLEHLGYSIIVGHTHRQARVHKTTHDINGDPTTLTAVETGCMCKIDGLGYTVNPDWQNGFATANVFGDGKFNIDLATYFDGNLVWRDQRYS